MQNERIRIGSRGSKLAVWQANFIKHQLEKFDPSLNVEIHIIETTGDQSSEAIRTLGGKGVFIKEIEQALIEKSIDLAVHSFKDITARSDARLKFCGFLLNERVTDAFILFNHTSIQNQPLNLATGSLRRVALCQYLYPNITCHPIRGNIDTRIQKSKDLNYDGLILSTAGLQRLNYDNLITIEPDPLKFIPAPGQGIIALQTRHDDLQLANHCTSICSKEDVRLGGAYYQFLKGIEFNCNLPLGALIDGSVFHVFLDSNEPRYFKFQLSDLDTAIDTIKGAVID
tara:strand:- start:82 stop:936 length:855 start_codon:yes stop_codon:yes gene_type:complete